MYNLEVPITITKTSLVTKFSISNINLKLFESVTFTVILFDENDNPVGTKSIIIEGDDYNKWFDDDNYVINYINNFLKN